MAGDELDIVRLRNDFYRDGLNKIFIALSVVGAIIALLLAMSFYLYTQRPDPVVFVTDEDGRAFAPAPLDKAFLKESDLLQWVNDTVTRSFSFDFIDYKDQVDDLKPFYTDIGYAKLLDLFNTYANPTQVATNKLFISAGASGTPVIYNQGVADGRYIWILHIPLSLHYSSGQKNSVSQFTLEVTVTRTQVDDELAGIAIDNITIYKPA